VRERERVKGCEKDCMLHYCAKPVGDGDEEKKMMIILKVKGENKKQLRKQKTRRIKKKVKKLKSVWGKKTQYRQRQIKH